MLTSSGPNPFRPDSGVFRANSDGLQIHGAAMVRDEILAAIPNTFGRLLALASFRVPGTANYEHTQLNESFPGSVVTAVLSRAHQRAFTEWLAHSLEEQHKQLNEFFAHNMMDGRPRFPIEVRLGLVPPAAKTAEQALFLSDLDCLFDVMGIQP